MQFRSYVTWLVAFMIAACGGGESVSPPDTPTGFGVRYSLKSYSFSWTAAGGASHYQLFEDPDGSGPLPEQQIGGTLTTTSLAHSLAGQLLHQRLNATYRLRACNTNGCGAFTAAIQPDLIKAIGYFKASNTEANDNFGGSVALSGDGNTLAVGVSVEASNATGINGNQNNNSAPFSGAVYVFTRGDEGWAQQAYLKASNTEAGDAFGFSVALSSDGNTLAVGATSEDSSATGINGNQSDNSAVPTGMTPAKYSAGAAYLFTRSAGAWSQQAYIKAGNSESGDAFGTSVALSGDGNTLAVGAWREASGSTGINGDQSDNSAPEAGAVYVFTRGGINWLQQAYIKPISIGTKMFGSVLGLSSDGNTLAVGWAGAVDVFLRVGATWTQETTVEASNKELIDLFGASLALSGDGRTLAVGAIFEDSSATGIDGNQADNSARNAGAVYVFTKDAGGWSQQAYIKASNTDSGDNFGASVALSRDGNTLAVGADWEASIAIGIGGGQSDNSTNFTGAAYLFTRNTAGWSQQAYVKPPSAGVSRRFGSSLALSGDGSTLAVGSPEERSGAVEVGGDTGDTSAAGAGAVFLY